jgi:hypothetical protein
VRRHETVPSAHQVHRTYRCRQTARGDVLRTKNESVQYIVRLMSHDSGSVAARCRAPCILLSPTCFCRLLPLCALLLLLPAAALSALFRLATRADKPLM